MPERLVLFDIDGTLLLTAGAGRRAITVALRDHVSDPAAFERIRFDGKPILKSCGSCSSRADIPSSAMRT